MRFEYCDRRYTGTRDEIQKKLRLDLRYFELRWLDGIWSLGKETTDLENFPMAVKESLVRAILNRVPKKLTGWVEDDILHIEDDNGNSIQKVSIYDI